MSKQTRIVLRGDLVEEAMELCQVTHSGSLSELVTILISRYGRHLKETWEVSAACAQSAPVQEFEPRIASHKSVEFNDPIAL